MHNNTPQLFILAALVGVVGCTEPRIKQEPVYPVVGQLLFGGEPVAGAVVCFHPQDESNGLRSHAEVAADGTFALSTYIKSDGAREGKYAVTIYWPDVHAAPGSANEDESSELPPDRLKGRFASQQTTILRATVVSERVEFEPFDLKSAELQQSAEYHLRPKV